MDNLDEPENNAKVSDSAYSNSCSNSQSRRSRSSTHSGSHSSRSSGYGGKPSICGSSNHLNQPAAKRIKDKDGKKKKTDQKNIVQTQAGVEFRLPNPAMTYEVKEQVSDALPTSPILAQVENLVQEHDIITDQKSLNDIVTSYAPQSTEEIVMSKPSSSDGFSCVISMHDGVVMYTTPTLTSTLGFPKEMWIGRSFIDFIHPLDHGTFASQITSGFATPEKVNCYGTLNAVQSPDNCVSTMFCRIRRYRGLTIGFGVKETAVAFLPFMLKLSFKNVTEEEGVDIYLVIQATPLFSAFKTAHEIITKPMPFVLRHVSNGSLEYIDHESVPILGYLPQDVTGKDILSLYHPDDLVYMRQLYETIIRDGAAPRSKPYRLMVQNGHYLKLETEWSSFINPWSRKLEFVIGKHHVVEGPGNPDVFQPPIPEKSSDEDKNNIQGIKDSIVRIMNEVLTKPAEIAKQQMTKRCSLASFMESLIEEPPKLEEELRLELQDNENSYYERDSVMLGGISPHHDYNDSKSSSTTPLSYNQLNFNENLQRYFSSHQQICSDEYQDAIVNSIATKDQNSFSGGFMSPMAQQSGDSAELTSSSESTGVAVEKGRIKPPRLTESLLNKHNSEMEKTLVMQHRECRPSNKENREKACFDYQKKKYHLARCNASFLPTLGAPCVTSQPHGLKRASKPLEGERAHKQHCAEPRAPRRRTPPAVPPALQPPSGPAPSTSQWSQGSTGMNPVMSNIGLIPMYYIPTAVPTMPSTSEMSTDSKTSVPHMQYMMYGQPVFGSPIMMSPINPQVTYPIQRTLSAYPTPQNSLGLTTSNYEEACKPGLQLKPGNPRRINLWPEKSGASESQATSFKVEQCSGLSSNNSSTSNALNRSIEVGQDPSSMRSTKMNGIRPRNSEQAVDRTDEESSYSSFYSSFFKTESGSAEDSGDAKKGSNQRSKLQSDQNSLDKITKRKKEAPWMDQVSVTPELIYKYQILSKNINDVLTTDKQKITSFLQPSLVNEQLGQLYMDMELEGVAARLTLEEGITSSGSSGEENVTISTNKRPRKKREYNRLVMIYEENAPLPPPCGVVPSELEATEPATPLV